ncbi:MAG: 5,10-methylenetetrahydrofolate reductase [Polyangiaceae bacterium]
MSEFRDKVRARRPGLLTYGLTPPRASNSAAKLSDIAQRQRARIATLPVDALVLYDLQDESSRDGSPRPFPFLPTLDPFAYARDYLGDFQHETIVYRAVGNYEEAEFSAWLSATERAAEPTAVTFVGSPTAHPTGRLALRRAYELYTACCERLLLGGVCIAERHLKKADEHLRILSKQQLGCAFFISQAVYDPAANRALLADLAREAEARGVRPAPLLLTITPCGTEKALEFMKWLGVAFDPEIERRLRQSPDMLRESIAICEDLIRDFASQSSGPIPLGINVESVSIRRADIDAAESLVAFARRELDARG